LAKYYWLGYSFGVLSLALPKLRLLGLLPLGKEPLDWLLFQLKEFLVAKALWGNFWALRELIP